MENNSQTKLRNVFELFPMYTIWTVSLLPNFKNWESQNKIKKPNKKK